MKKLILLIAVLSIIYVAYGQETKTIQIYKNGITHTNIKANITYSNDTIIKEDAFYTVTYEEMWTTRMTTVVVYHGNLIQMSYFLKSILKFAEANKDNIGSYTRIEDRTVSMTQIAGIKCITIKVGDESINTNFKSISDALYALDIWIIDNK
jgi:hypothetical protein